MNKINKFYVIFSFISVVISQVNTENFRSEQIDRSFINKLDLSFSYQGADTKLIDLLLEYRIDYIQSDDNKFYLITNYEQSYEKVSNEEINYTIKKSFLHLRNTRKFYRSLDIEFFTQFEANDFIEISSRKLVGSGLRIPLYNNKFFSNHMGIGIMYEVEDYFNNSQNTKLYKSTNYINNKVILDKLILSNVAYLQFDLQSANNFRLLLDNSIEFIISKNIYITTNLNYRYNNKANSDDLKNYVQVSSGLAIIF